MIVIENPLRIQIPTPVAIGALLLAGFLFYCAANVLTGKQ